MNNSHAGRLVIVAVLAFIWSGYLLGARDSFALAAGRPNFVVIQTDDQAADLLRSRYVGSDGVSRLTMPRTVKLLLRRGTEFTNYYATSPVCAPSRASLLTGQYPRNNRLLSNNGILGGWSGWQRLDLGAVNVPTALQQVGYRTALYGKFINGYHSIHGDGPTTVIPRGFDDWFAVSFRPKVTKGSQQPHGSTALFYGYYVNANGFPRGPFGNVNYESNQNLDPSRCKMATAKVRVGSRYVRCNYLTDVIARRAVADIRNADSRPFFMQVGFDAPHSDTARPVGPQPATRHLGSASRTKLPRDPAFNEADLSDKPPLIRAAAPDPLTRREVRIVTRSYRRELESLRSVDEAIGAILNALRGTGRLRNTYVVFTSDQGKFRGEHRLSFGKFLAYEESSSVSMTVTGPGVPKDRESEEIVGNIDVPATILSLSGASTEYPVDGRSLEQYWTQPELLTRRPIGISFGFRTGTDPGAGVAVAAPALQYRAFRVGPYKYVRYLDGEHELYDLSRDPHELLNVYDHDAYAEVRAYMERHLSDVFTCQGPSCQADLPLWPMPVD